MKLTTKNIKIRKDSYRKSRGKNTKLFVISCAKCETEQFIYQKDGPGGLIRMYADRIIYPESESIKYSPDQEYKNIPNIVCTNCKENLAIKMIYKAESRVAFRVIRGMVRKGVKD